MASLLRQAFDLNMRYQKALGAATLEYLQGLLSLFFRKRAVPAAAIVLEAASGECAVGAFAVANHLPRPVMATFHLSSFRDEHGTPAKVELEIVPPRVQLDAAQRVVVRIAAAITDDLVASAAYSGSVSIPGITNQPIPIVVRRRV